jgi:hypothetical protein
VEVDKNKAEKIVLSLKSAVLSPLPLQQQVLFPIEIVETYPNDQNSADLSQIGKGRDGKHYAIKTINDLNGHVPASEYFCYQLARLVFIPTPPFEPLQLQCGSIAFGSAWEGGVKSLKSFNDIVSILSGNEVEDLEKFLGKVYAFDLFINNDDRHFGNYIFRDSFQGKKIGLAFDFSRAWMVLGPFGYNCLDTSSNTMKCNDLIRKMNRYDKQSALDLLERIFSISVSEIENILNSMHGSWMTDVDKTTVIRWWGSVDFIARITKIKGVV